MALNERRIVSQRIPYIPVTVAKSSSSQRRETEALVDTGYTGSVVVPAGFFTNGQPSSHRITLRLADGSPITAPAYRGELHIGSTRLESVLITELGNETIIGLKVLQSFTLTLDHGREIIIEP